MKILPTWPIATAALIFGLLSATAATRYVYQHKIDVIRASQADLERQRAEIRAADERDARELEQKWAARLGQVEQEKTDENNRIAARYVAQLDSLRQRADRRPAPTSGVPETTTSCAGATGAELSRPDAEFLIGESARADRQRAALAACYGAYDALR